jgi:hypothetical protein
MFKRIFDLLSKLLGNGAARVLSGAGLSLASYAALSAAVLAALNGVAGAFANVSADVANLVLLFGVGESISIIGAAMLTRVALQSAALGITRSGGA